MSGARFAHRQRFSCESISGNIHSEQWQKNQNLWQCFCKRLNLFLFDQKISHFLQIFKHHDSKSGINMLTHSISPVRVYLGIFTPSMQWLTNPKSITIYFLTFMRNGGPVAFFQIRGIFHYFRAHIKLKFFISIHWLGKFQLDIRSE